jgi:hypothetical protein
MATRKNYLGEFPMPKEINAAAQAFAEAVKDCGYDFAILDTANGALGSALLSSFDTGNKYHVEHVDGRWKRYEWVVDDE